MTCRSELGVVAGADPRLAELPSKQHLACGGSTIELSAASDCCSRSSAASASACANTTKALYQQTKPCKCGSAPTFYESQQYGIQIMRLECSCAAKKSATLMYTKPEDRERMRQVAIDGWNLSE